MSIESEGGGAEVQASQQERDHETRRLIQQAELAEQHSQAHSANLYEHAAEQLAAQGNTDSARKYFEEAARCGKAAAPGDTEHWDNLLKRASELAAQDTNNS